ncbi:related to RSM24-mitochondrial ribosomal protein, small subunit [Rhynchosporium agropyri]|uniref:Related to RSM24-mitochondrial ribosomal protein, small subunit n=1 Tax=Rhynchosporium agropyri TaxID=914238 RepID=A0A1E1KDB2_9HELO|nr:related to RSM24-mitochondrial ribosomal protein, small subunit [Rhynchosporium agropyri]
MATALQGVRFTARSCLCSQTPYRYGTSSIGPGRAFSTTIPRVKRTNRIRTGLSKARKSDSEDAAELLDLERQIAEERKRNADGDEWTAVQAKIDAQAKPYELQDTQQRRKLKDTFMNMGEAEPWEDEYTMEDDDDDLNSLAHGELEQHREMRHYARIIAWEMPLLSKLVQPFQPPTREMPLRFRYTTYMGEQHPSEKKVVLEFSPADLPRLTKQQTDKLRKLAGVRYNPETDVVKMSCEMFETQSQNKRYLGDVVGSLLREARDPTDTFEDIPLDTRHHHFKAKPQFPKEWAITEARKVELQQYRAAMISKDQQMELTGQLIDGIQQIEEGLRKTSLKESIPEPVMIGRGKGGKKVAVRR